SLARQYADAFCSGREEWIVEENVLILFEPFLSVFRPLYRFFGKPARQISSYSARDQVGVCDPSACEAFGEVDEEFPVPKRPHEHGCVAEEDAVDGEPVEVAYYHVHLVQETSKVLSPSSLFNSVQLFNSQDLCMIQHRI